MTADRCHRCDRVDCCIRSEADRDAAWASARASDKAHQLEREKRIAAERDKEKAGSVAMMAMKTASEFGAERNAERDSLLAQLAEAERRAQIAEEDSFKRRSELSAQLAEAEAQAAVMREHIVFLRDLGQRVKHRCAVSDDGPLCGTCHVLASPTGRATLAELTALRKVAEAAQYCRDLSGQLGCGDCEDDSCACSGCQLDFALAALATAKGGNL